MNCKECDNFQDDYLVKVIDYVSPSPFADDEQYHFEEAYHCTWNGETSFSIEDLPKKNCRCKE